jgi:fatty-acyl-CoA synthase
VRAPGALPGPERNWITATTLGDLLDRRAAQHPTELAAAFPGERADYRVLATKADRYARGLLALGTRPGDRVGILLPNCVDHLAVLFAAAKIGAVATPVNLRYKLAELRRIIGHSGMGVLVTAPPESGAADQLTLLEQALEVPRSAWASGLDLPGLPELRHVVVLGSDTGEAFAAGAGATSAQVAHRQARVRVRDTAALVYTSGTTAAPKGAMLSHEAFTRLSAGIADRLELAVGERVWTAIPLFHGGGITFALTCVHAGAALVHAGHFDAGQAVRAIVDEDVTVAIAAFETIWLPVLDHPDFAGADLSRMRVVEVVGVAERVRAMAARIPHATHISTVAMTESTAFLSLGRLDDDQESRLTTGGHLMPGMEARVVDVETRAELPAGTPGELLFRGAHTFDGYFRDPEATAATVDAEGWVRTGDLVVQDRDGRLTFVSRLKDMLKVGGENVAAAEVEGHLLGHPAVAVVAVVAAPDAYYGETPAAFVQLKEGCSATEEELVAFCVGQIATYRVPRYVRFVDEWPMSGTKIQKHVLRTRIADELAAAGITEAPRIRTRTKAVAK